jgi:hypothetical protein
LEWHRQNISTHSKPDDFVFSNPATGKPWSQNTVRDYTLYPAYERANQLLPQEQKIVPRPYQYGYHICRHSVGSLIIDLTGDVSKAQRQLRHAKGDTTLNIYGHKVGNSDVHAAQQLADFVYPTLATKPLPNRTEDGAVEEQTLLEVS